MKSDEEKKFILASLIVWAGLAFVWTFFLDNLDAPCLRLLTPFYVFRAVRHHLRQEDQHWRRLGEEGRQTWEYQREECQQQVGLLHVAGLESDEHGPSSRRRGPPTGRRRRTNA